MKSLKIVFMGTPVFACAILESLLQSRHEVIAVVSQPDKKVGRKQEVTHTPVKQVALQHNIPVFQPIRIKEEYDDILALKPDLIVTCAYGQMIPEEVLHAPVYGSLNVHASLLPKLRGGAPIHKAIIYGYDKTGVSIMRMVKQMDAGDYMLQKEVTIATDETTASLHDKLMKVGATAILEAIDLLVEDKAVFVKQDEAEATYAYNISKEEEHIDLSKSTKEVSNQIRGLISWPVGYVYINDKKIKLHEIKENGYISSVEAGHFITHDKKLLLVCKDGCIEVCILQMEGKKKSDAKSFINGFSSFITKE